MTFLYDIGSVTNLVVSFGEYKTEYRQRMKRAMRFMRAHNVEPDLQVGWGGRNLLRKMMFKISKIIHLMDGDMYGYIGVSPP